MRGLPAFLLCTLGVLAPPAANASLPTRIDIRARTIALYAGASPIVQADGFATARIGARVVRADALRYDLTKNRIVASGHVEIASPPGELRGDACALELARDTATLLRLDGERPQTLVFRGDDVRGDVVPPPEGAFDVADLSGHKPFLRGPHAVIVPNATVRFTPARVLTDIGAVVPSPSYLFTFETNPSFAQQSLPGSTFDQPYGLFGTPNSLASLHFMYSPSGGLAIGLDEHLVNGSKSYLVASALPTVAGGRLDVVGFQQLTPVMSQQIVASRQSGYGAVQYQLLHNESNSVTSLTLAQDGPLETADLRISSLSRLLPHLFSYKLAAGVGYDHRAGMLPLASDTRTTLEGLFTTSPRTIPLGFTLSSSLDLVRTIYNFPRQTGTSVFTTFATKPLSPVLRLIGEVQLVQTFDRYRTGQSFFYPPQTITLPDGTIYYGYAAYNGASTQRMYALTTTYSPSANFNLQLALVHHRDFPQFDGFGNAPYSLGFDVRVRPAGGPAIEFGRAYLFNWGGQRFSPSYTLSIAP